MQLCRRPEASQGCVSALTGPLCAAQAEADSQVQLYRAQISKMQLALERADQENSRVEQELRIALAAPGKLREAQAERRAGASSLAALRDRVRSMSLLAPSAEPNAEERLQVTHPPASPCRCTPQPHVCATFPRGRPRSWCSLSASQTVMLHEAAAACCRGAIRIEAVEASVAKGDRASLHSA